MADLSSGDVTAIVTSVSALIGSFALWVRARANVREARRLSERPRPKRDLEWFRGTHVPIPVRELSDPPPSLPPARLMCTSCGAINPQACRPLPDYCAGMVASRQPCLRAAMRVTP